jgi:hypothetical protein
MTVDKKVPSTILGGWNVVCHIECLVQPFQRNAQSKVIIRWFYYCQRPPGEVELWQQGLGWRHHGHQQDLTNQDPSRSIRSLKGHTEELMKS